MFNKRKKLQIVKNMEKKYPSNMKKYIINKNGFDIPSIMKKDNFLLSDKFKDNEKQICVFAKIKKTR